MHAATLRALDVLAHSRLRGREGGFVATRQVELARDPIELVRGERQSPLH